MEWKEKRKGKGGEKKLTQLVTIHTRRVAAGVGGGNQFHCLPLSKCISIYNPWNSVCVLGSVLEIDE